MTIQFLVIAYALLAMVIVIALLSKKGHEEDSNLRRIKAIEKDAVKGSYKNVDTSFYERVVKPLVDKITQANKYGENATKTAKKKKQDEAIALKLRKAGMHISVDNFNFFKTAFTIVVSLIALGFGLVVLQVSTKGGIAIILVGIVIGVLGPSLFLSMKIKSYQTAIKDQLADTIDLMSVCMEAGLSFDASLVKISERMSGPFIDELMTVFRQIQLGKSRNDALKSMSDTTDIPEVKTFVSAVIQANDMGIPITNVLQAQAEQLRMNKEEEIKEASGKIPTKMTIPTVIFIMPTIFVIILGPVVFNVMDSLKGVF
jgi:tight adherence protein C